MPFSLSAGFVRDTLSISAMMTAVVLASFGAADAKSLMSACQRKHSMCVERCLLKDKSPDGSAGNACIKRTCDKQNPGCGWKSGGDKGGGKLSLPPDKPRDDKFGAGILSNTPGFHSQGPAPMGAPAAAPAAPSAPPVIIR